VPGIVTSAITRSKAGKTIDLELDSLHIRKSDIVLDRKKIHIVLHVKTKAALRLKRIKPGKVHLIKA